MAKARALDRRRRSIRSIRKITRTMELIATAKFQRAMSRATAATAYTKHITKLVNDLVHSGLEISHPLLDPRLEPKRCVLLVLTGNRGMCGGYNGNVFRAARTRYSELRTKINDVELAISGKRGISAFRFRKIVPDETYTQFEDRPEYDEVEELANRYLQEFAAGRIDRLEVVHTRFDSFSKQEAVAETLLPLAQPETDDRAHRASAAEAFYEFLPSGESLLDEVVPMSFKVRLFKCFLDAAVSEQVARMVAMKAATENADQMISNLSTAYNRARQGQITNELLEVISGADALS